LLRFQKEELGMWIIINSAKFRWETGFDSVNKEPLQVRWHREIRIVINASIPS
jgi:hypothetical protein